MMAKRKKGPVNALRYIFAPLHKELQPTSRPSMDVASLARKDRHDNAGMKGGVTPGWQRHFDHLEND